jgi:hypothetical protein
MDECTFKALGASLAGTNEWVSSGVLVQVHESIDPSSEAIEVDIASTLGLRVEMGKGKAVNLSSEVHLTPSHFQEIIIAHNKHPGTLYFQQKHEFKR